MSSKLDLLKAAFAPSAKKENTFTKFYNFWKIATGETATVRFLPDANPDNPRQFVVENLTHSFTINGKKRVVACLSMYGEPCPACEESRDFYSQAEKAGEPKPDPGKGIQAGPLTQIGKKYYRKKEYLAQVHVQNSPIEFEKNEGHDYEMPISIGPQIFKLIQAAFSSGDLDEIPFEFKGGYDFRIVKSEQGGQANYTLSKFVPKQSDLPEDVVANLNLYDLATLRNRKTDRATMEAMIIADRTGQALVLPNAAGGSDDGDDSGPIPFTSSKAVAEAVATPTSQDSTEAAAPAAETPNKVNDVLAQIRARAAANKAAE